MAQLNALSNAEEVDLLQDQQNTGESLQRQKLARKGGFSARRSAEELCKTFGSVLRQPLRRQEGVGGIGAGMAGGGATRTETYGERAQTLMKEFQQWDLDGSGNICPAELAELWTRSASSACSRKLSDKEVLLIAAAVENTFDLLDADRSGSVSWPEWLHSVLMDRYSPGPTSAQILADRIVAQDSISDLVHDWLSVDPAATGMVTREEVAEEVGVAAADFRRSSVLEIMLDHMNSTGNSDLTYGEFCAARCGLCFRHVEIYLYDLSKRFARVLSPLLLGQHEEGVWHSSIVVQGVEFYYYGEIRSEVAGGTEFGTPTEKIELGVTLRSTAELDKFLETIDNDFNRESYDIFEHNCNDLSDTVALFLLGRHIPNSVRLMTERLAKSPVCRAVANLLTGALDGSEAGSIMPNDGDPASGDASAPAFSFADVGSVVLESDENENTDLDSTRLVYAEVPDCAARTVAYVLREADEDTTDLKWLDATGRFHVAAGARTRDLRPYLLHETKQGGEGEDARLEVFKAAQQAAQRCNVEPDAQQRRSSKNASRSTCPSGHMLKTKGATASCGSIPCVVLRRGQAACSVCHCALGPREWRASCAPCRYAVCQGCWEQTTPDGGQGSHSLGLQPASAHLAQSCPSGHTMDRMVGQQVRGDCACSLCGRSSLGATCPFFFSCRICDYDLCHRCVRRDRRRAAP